MISAQTQKDNARFMLNELEHVFLTVVLIPGTTPERMVRHVEQRNPDWYRELCRRHPRWKQRPRHQLSNTKIKREHVIRCLKAIISETPCEYYRDDILEIVRAY